MAEMVVGEPIDWAQVEQPDVLLEELLGLSYAELTDPDNSASPLWEGYDPDQPEKDFFSVEAIERLKEAWDQVYGSGCEPGILRWGAYGVYGTPQWHELVQGRIADCGFLATLASTLFAGRALPHQQRGDEHVFSFFNSQGREELVRTSPVLPRHPVRYHATSRESREEVWPILWEKAFELLLRQDCPQHEPIFCTIGRQPVETIFLHLFGLDLPPQTAPQIIGSLLEEADRGGPTTRICVVWTSPTRRHTPGSKPPVLSYRHAYSVLGLVRRPDGERDVVLNDPNGIRLRGLSADAASVPWIAPHADHCRGCASGVLVISEADFLTDVIGGLSIHPDQMAPRAGWD